MGASKGLKGTLAGQAGAPLAEGETLTSKNGHHLTASDRAWTSTNTPIQPGLTSACSTGRGAHHMVPHAHQRLDQDVAVQQHEGAHELVGAGLTLLPQPATAANQLCMGHLHSTTTITPHSHCTYVFSIYKDAPSKDQIVGTAGYLTKSIEGPLDSNLEINNDVE